MPSSTPSFANARIWDTCHVAPREAFDFYQGAVCEAFSHLTPVAPSPIRKRFEARVETFSLSAGCMNIVQATSHLVTRTEREIARGNVDWHYLNLNIGGACVVDQDGGRATGLLGDLVLFSGARPFAIEHRMAPSLGVVSFMAPGEMLRDRLGGRDPTKPCLPSRHPLFGRLIRETAQTLHDKREALTQEARERLFEALFDFAALASASATSANVEPRLRSRALHAAMRAHLERHLCEPGLDADRLAAAHGISPRYAHKIFAMHGDGKTIGECLTDLRLDRAAARLGEGARETIVEAAFAAGFSDLSGFYRAFRRRYGCAPGAYRHRR